MLIGLHMASITKQDVPDTAYRLMHALTTWAHNSRFIIVNRAEINMANDSLPYKYSPHSH